MKRYVVGGAGEAEIRDCDERGVQVWLPEASPPGASLELLITGVEIPYLVKVKGCRREGDRFLVAGRWVNLSRPQRLSLASG